MSNSKGDDGIGCLFMIIIFFAVLLSVRVGPGGISDAATAPAFAQCFDQVLLECAKQQTNTEFCLEYVKKTKPWSK